MILCGSFGVNFEYQRTDFYENFHKLKVSDVFSAERRVEFYNKTNNCFVQFLTNYSFEMYIFEMKKFTVIIVFHA